MSILNTLYAATAITMTKANATKHAIKGPCKSGAVGKGQGKIIITTTMFKTEIFFNQYISNHDLYVARQTARNEKVNI